MCICAFRNNPLALDRGAAAGRESFAVEDPAGQRAVAGAAEGPWLWLQQVSAPGAPPEHPGPGKAMGNRGQPGHTCPLAFFRTVTLASLYFREALRDLLIRHTARWILVLYNFPY